MVKRQQNERTQLPEFPLWHGIPRMVPPPFGPPKLPLAPAEPPAPSTPPSALASTSQLTPASSLPANNWRPATPYPGADYRPPPRYTPPPEPSQPIPFGRIAVLASVVVIFAAAAYTVLHHAPSVAATPTATPTVQPRPKQHPAPTTIAIQTLPPSPTESGDTFPDAVNAIAAESMIHYAGQQEAAPWDASSWDIYVTADGSMFGTETVQAEQFNVLIFNGVAYFENSTRQDAWSTGDDGLVQALPGSLLDTPTGLADKLRNSLPGTQQLSTSLDGTPSIAVDTDAGQLYFSAATPQTLLRIDSINSSGGDVETQIKPTTSAERRQINRDLLADIQQVGAG
jgi:hypothetical protein